MNMTGVTGRSKKTAGVASNTIDAVNFFVETSAIFQKQFEKERSVALTSRQKLAKNLFFSY